jgi:hypothetical protein
MYTNRNEVVREREVQKEKEGRKDNINTKTKLNSVALVYGRTIATEQRSLVGEVNAQLLRIEGVAWWAQRVPTAVFSTF